MNAPVLTPYLFLSSKLPSPKLSLFVFLPHPSGKTFKHDSSSYDEKGNINVIFTLVDDPGNEAEFYNCRVEIKYPPYVKVSVRDGRTVNVRVRSEMEIPGVDWCSEMSIPFYRSNPADITERDQLAINQAYLHFEENGDPLAEPKPGLFIPCTKKIFDKIAARLAYGLPRHAKGRRHLINLQTETSLIYDLLMLLKTEAPLQPGEKEALYFVRLTTSKAKSFASLGAFAEC